MARYKRTDLIADAHRKIGVVHQLADLKPEWMARGVRYLNAILREEGQVNSRGMSGLYVNVDYHFPLRDGRWYYPVTSGAGSFPTDVEDITSAVFRGLDGLDAPLTLLNERDYNLIEEKDLQGDPEAIYFKAAANRSLQAIYLHPIGPENATTPSCVTGSDGNDYFCIFDHTSAAITKPTSGPQWPQYWAKGSIGTPSTFAVDTDYTSGELVRVTYRRALAEMEDPGDNPDMPEGWDRYLLFRLAHDLSSDFSISLEERTWLENNAIIAKQALFPGAVPTHDNFHDKARFY